MNSRINRRNADSPAGLNENRETAVTEAFHQTQRVPLDEWFPSRKFDNRESGGVSPRSEELLNRPFEWLGELIDVVKDLRQRPASALGESVSRITVRTAEIAAGRPDEHAGQSGKGALPLQA